MKYITIVAKDFEEAVRKARDQYGPSLRIHSRRDVQGRGGFLWLAKRTHVELTCYLSDADSQPVDRSTPDKLKSQESELEQKNDVELNVVKQETLPQQDVEPPAVSDIQIHQEQLIDHAVALLTENDFSTSFIDELLSLLREALYEYHDEVPSREEFELIIVDKIVSLIEIDHATQLSPPHVFVLVGPTGIGKTTTIAKIAALYGLQKDPEYKRSVHMITIDSFRAGAFEQLSAFGGSLGIEVEKVNHEEDFFRVLQKAESADLILVDTIGKSPRDADLAIKMKALLSVPKREETQFYLAISGAMKTEDIRRAIDQYASFGLTSIVVTKMDETETLGNVLSVCRERSMPILFFTDGQRVPKDIHKASASTMLGQLHGFSLDFQNLWVNQIKVDQ
jgi:flagellar biosynthesis protein FlhF